MRVSRLARVASLGKHGVVMPRSIAACSGGLTQPLLLCVDAQPQVDRLQQLQRSRRNACPGTARYEFEHTPARQVMVCKVSQVVGDNRPQSATAMTRLMGNCLTIPLDDAL